MIAKVPAKRGDGRSSFSTLAHYIAGDKLDRETGEILRAGADVVSVTNCLSVKTASAEMKAAADANPRIGDPVYHAVLSWREGENPSDKQMIEAAKAAQKAVGMEGHQYVYSIHRDTQNAHVHMMINRVHPDTSKAVYPTHDFYKLDKCMREVELAQGWAHDKGPYVVKDGKVVRAERDAAKPPTLPTKARDFESATGHQSLVSYAQAVAPEVVKSLEAGNWAELHSCLQKQGLAIMPAGQGFKIYSTDDPNQTPIKASDMAGELGGGKLKKRLGEYEKPLHVVRAAKPERTYKRDPQEREQRREERARERALLKEQYKEASASKRTAAGGRDAKAEYARLRSESRAIRERIKSEGYDKTTAKALLSIAAMEAAQKHEALKKSLSEERKANRPKDYRTWVADRAEEGDRAAIRQLKGWEYEDKRKRAAAEKSAAEEAARGALKGSDQQQAEPGEVMAGIRWRVDRSSGDVTYQQAGRDLLRDTGKQVSVLDQQSDQAITAGLLLASQKFGNQLTLTGSPEFQRRVIETAVQKNMQVKFVDPAAEQYRQQLIQAAKEQGNGNTNGRTETKTRPGASPGREITGAGSLPDLFPGALDNQNQRHVQGADRGGVLRGDEGGRVQRGGNRGRD